MSDADDARMGRIEALLTDMQVDLTKMPTMDDLSVMVGTTVGIAAAVIWVLVGVLIYLQRVHSP